MIFRYVFLRNIVATWTGRQNAVQLPTEGEEEPTKKKISERKHISPSRPVHVPFANIPSPLMFCSSSAPPEKNSHLRFHPLLRTETRTDRRSLDRFE